MYNRRLSVVGQFGDHGTGNHRGTRSQYLFVLRAKSAMEFRLLHPDHGHVKIQK